MDYQETKHEDVYEQYVDASVALFMKYYCDAMYDGVTDGANLGDRDAATSFPAELDTRCRSLIKKTMKRKQLQRRFRNTGKALRYLCSVTVVFLSLMSLLFMTVEAVRIPIINYYIEKIDGNYLEIGASDDSEEEMTATFDPSDPLAGIIPDAYQLVTQDVVSEFDFLAAYVGSDNSQVFIKAKPLSGTSGVDLEGMDNTQHFQIYNCEAILIEEDNVTRLIWIHEERSATFTLIVSGSSDLDAVFIADQIIRKIS